VRLSLSPDGTESVSVKHTGGSKVSFGIRSCFAWEKYGGLRFNILGSVLE
jgi:hypothetical protein